MTISKAIAEFLSRFKDLEIETDHVSDGRDKKENIDGSYELTEYYQFFARQASLSDKERLENDEWMEDLTYRIDDYPVKYDYPVLDGGRRILEISVTGAPCATEIENKNTLYQISLSITYTRERKGI